MRFENLIAALESREQVTELHCTGLREWTDDLLSFPHLKRLDLSGCSFPKLPASIGQLVGLEELNLSSGQLVELPPDFFELKNLRSLDLRFNPGQSFRLGDFGGLPQLRQLLLPYSSQADGWEAVCECRQLEVLDLSGMELFRIGPEIGQLTRLRILNLSNCPISELPEELWTLVQLEELELQALQVTKLSESIGNLVQLRKLNLLQVPLQALPESLGRLLRLETLHLASSELAALPESLGQLKELQDFRLWQAPLGQFPQALVSLPRLRLLDLSSSQLDRLPDDLSAWTEMVELDLSRSGLTSLGEGVEALRSLTHLKVDQSPLTHLPDSLGALSCLQVLSLQNCQLTEVPASLGQLSELRCLYLTGNPIRSLPSTLAGLVGLRVLSLARTKCQSLPDCLESIQGMTSLRLTELEFTQVEVDRLLDYKQRRMAPYASVDMPRVVRPAKPFRPSQAPLAARVVAQIKRLGGQRIACSSSASITIRGREFPLPEALRQWRDEVVFPPTARFRRNEIGGIRLGWMPLGQDYEAFSNLPYFELGSTDQHGILLVDSQGKSPSDPWVGFLDHDDFWRTEASMYGLKLSEFLQSLQPEEPAQ